MELQGWTAFMAQIVCIVLPLAGCSLQQQGMLALQTAEIIARDSNR